MLIFEKVLAGQFTVSRAGFGPQAANSSVLTYFENYFLCLRAFGQYHETVKKNLKTIFIFLLYRYYKLYKGDPD